MSISTKIEPTSDLKEFWKLVLKRVHVEFANHKAPAIYGEVSAIIPLLYILTIAAISGDIYLAVNILMKAGVKPAFVFIQIGADIVLAILPFLLLKLGLKFLDKVANKNLKLFYELDSQLKRKDESAIQYQNRKKANDKALLPPVESNLFWSNLVSWLTNAAIFGVAYWKIHTYASTIPYNIINTANGKMVITLSILVALFHIIATENTLVHSLYWFHKKKAIDRYNQVMNINDEPNIDDTEIKYVGNYTTAKSGYTEIVKEDQDKIVLKYAYIIRDEDINNLLARNTDKDAKMGIIAACKQIQLNQ